MRAFDADGPRIPVLGVDLRAGRLTRSGAGDYPVMRLARFNDLVLDGDTVNVVGSDTDNSFRITGCRGKVGGGAGNDRITWSAQFDLSGYPECEEGEQVTVHGGAGDDVLVGGARDDVLLGDAGTDSVDGNGGTDVCVAETTVNCEPA